MDGSVDRRGFLAALPAAAVTVTVADSVTLVEPVTAVEVTPSESERLVDVFEATDGFQIIVADHIS